jgi:hypothetical protein
MASSRARVSSAVAGLLFISSTNSSALEQGCQMAYF